MQSVPHDLLREYVRTQHFTSTTDIMQPMKKIFRDVIQQVMEVEMDEELGRERCQRSECEVDKVCKPIRAMIDSATRWAYII